MPLTILNMTPAMTGAATGTGGAGFLPDMLMVGGVLIITVCVFSMLRKRLRRSHRRPPSFQRQRSERHERHERARDEHAAKQSIESLVVEAEELVRRLAAHLDSKSARLETLIRQADERIARLDGGGAGPPSTSSPPSPGSSAPGAAHVESKLVDPISRDIYRLADEGLAPIEIAQRLSEGVGKVELILALRNN